MAKTVQVISLFLGFLLGASTAFGRVVDEVHFSGVTLFSGDEIQNIVEIQPGGDFTDAQIEKTKETVKAYYGMRGYEKVVIRAFFPEEGKGRILEFQVTEGDPTRVAEIQIDPLEISEAEFDRHWTQIRDLMGGKVGVRIGDPYDQEKLANGKRQIQDALVIDDFIGAKVLDIQVETVPAPPSEISPAIASRWVRLTVRVSLGDRVSFGFRNNTVIQYADLLAIIKEQRAQGLGSDFIATLTTKFKEQYQSLGYPFIEVQAYIVEQNTTKHQRHVTFDFDEGPRVLIDEIKFDGNLIFDPGTLRREFLRRASAVFQTGYYVDKDIRAAGELLREWMVSQGYLSAKIVTIETRFKQSLESRKLKRTQNDRVDLLVYLYEGEQTRVRSVTITGNQVLKADEIKEVLTVREDRPLNLYSLSDGIEALKQRYKDRGYLGIRVVNESNQDLIRYGQENRAADVEIHLEEGPLYRASRITVEGLEQTREKVVRQQLEFREEDTLEETKLAESEKNLKRLGIFSSASIRLFEDTERAGYKLVKVVVQEGTPGVVAGGVGFRNDLGVRLFGQLGYDDLWGENHSSSLSLIGNRRLGSDFKFVEYEAQATYIWPWFVMDRVNFRPIATFSRTHYILFDSDSRSISLNFDRRLLRSPEITGTISYSAESIRQFNAPIDNFDDENQTLNLFTITPALRLDTRDNPLSPTTGWYMTTSYDITSNHLGSHGFDNNGRYEISFTRFQSRIDRFFNLGNSVSLYLSGRFGYEQNRIPVDFDDFGNPKPPFSRIPLVKQFSLGGVGSLRGFREQSINYFTNAVITGSIGYSNYRMQLDLPFTGAMKIGPFLDAGTLTRDRFSFGGLRYGAGAGLHYQTPVGPVNFDWGFNLDPRPGESPYEIYFSIGVI